jgi:hypothetical protein
LEQKVAKGAKEKNEDGKGWDGSPQGMRGMMMN